MRARGGDRREACNDYRRGAYGVTGRSVRMGRLRDSAGNNARKRREILQLPNFPFRRR